MSVILYKLTVGMVVFGMLVFLHYLGKSATQNTEKSEKKHETSF